MIVFMLELVLICIIPKKPLAEVLVMLGITQEKYDQSLALLNQ